MRRLWFLWIFFTFSCTTVPQGVPGVLGPLVESQGVLFRYDPGYEAREIFIAGSFNGWRPDDEAYKMQDRGDGVWTLRVKLPPGEHQYKVVVDEIFTRDYQNPLNKPSGYDEPNSLVVVP